MAEYIKREDAEKALLGRCKETGYGGLTPDDIRLVMRTQWRIPTADVRPVVLCKDCKHSDTFSPDCTEATFPLKCLSIRYGGVYPDWFCEHGERWMKADV